MARFIVGEVVVVPFPFSDLSHVKRRPALVVAVPAGSDLVLCQITSQAKSDAYAIELQQTHFQRGMLNKPSYIRPNKLFTCDPTIIAYGVGVISEQKLNDTLTAITKLFRLSH